MEIETCSCGGTSFLETGFGLNVCLTCGLGKRGSFNAEGSFWSQGARLLNTQSYTRRKRFKKYLSRACRQQSAGTVPDATWIYLLARGPYKTPLDVVRVLKKAGKKLRRKCYDSLPFLVHSLCNCDVPTLTSHEYEVALKHFDVIDSAYSGLPFVSYLYALEYILHKIGRPDLCPYLSRIKCRKRRFKYNVKLNKIFGSQCTLPPVVSYM